MRLLKLHTSWLKVTLMDSIKTKRKDLLLNALNEFFVTNKISKRITLIIFGFSKTSLNSDWLKSKSVISVKSDWFKSKNDQKRSLLSISIFCRQPERPLVWSLELRWFALVGLDPSYRNGSGDFVAAFGFHCLRHSLDSKTGPRQSWRTAMWQKFCPTIEALGRRTSKMTYRSSKMTGGISKMTSRSSKIITKRPKRPEEFQKWFIKFKIHFQIYILFSFFYQI